MTLKDGKMMFKQIGTVRRRKLIGVVKAGEKGTFTVEAGGLQYKILESMASYFQLKDGDDAWIILPEGNRAEYAVIDLVL